MCHSLLMYKNPKVVLSNCTNTVTLEHIYFWWTYHFNCKCTVNSHLEHCNNSVKGKQCYGKTDGWTEYFPKLSPGIQSTALFLKRLHGWLGASVSVHKFQQKLLGIEKWKNWWHNDHKCPIWKNKSKWMTT